MKKKIIIMGAAGFDFHAFNTCFRDDENYKVVAFTAAQIPDIDDRLYPPILSGKLYPNGIPIYSENDLPALISKNDVDEVVLAYSDLSYMDVMHKASIVISNGACFKLLGPNHTMLKSKKKVISVCAVRTGAGKSQTTIKVCKILKDEGYRVGVVRHPMPYGDLSKQICQRFETLEDLDKHNCTIEEREEYELHIENGDILYAGVDYQEILDDVEKEADVIVWDGGNNDLPFYKPDLHIVMADPHRAGHGLCYHPSEVNLRMADVVIVNKVDTATEDEVELVINNIKSVNTSASIIKAESPITVDNVTLITNKRVLVIEDGPTLTHGGMPYGAGTIAAEKYKAKEIIDPRPFAIGTIKSVYDKYNHLDKILPAMGYSKKQIHELETTINTADCDTVIIGTPIDLTKLISINKECVNVGYELKIVEGDLKKHIFDIVK